MKNRKIQPTRTVAVVTVREAANMTPKGRRAVAKWLREKADDVELHGKNLSKRFTARYVCTK